MSDKDLKLISGKFMEEDLPKEKRFLEKYFNTPLQRRWVVYFITFGNYTHFVEHTGLRVSRRWMKKLKKRFLKLERVYSVAKSELDFDTIEAIATGKYKLRMEELDDNPKHDG